MGDSLHTFYTVSHDGLIFRMYKQSLQRNNRKQMSQLKTDKGLE